MMRRTFALAFVAGIVTCAIFLFARQMVQPPPLSDLPVVRSIQKLTPLVALEPADEPAPKRLLNGAVDPDFLKSHSMFLVRARSAPIGLLFLGDSITCRWSTEGRASWDRYFTQFNPVNFAIGGERTQHLLWEIDDGLLDNMHPQVIVFAIGTNNTDYPAANIIRGELRIVERMRSKLPDSKLLVLGILPRDWPWDAVWSKIKTVNAELAKIDNGKSIRFLDPGKAFLLHNRTIDAALMPDTLHPSAAGYQTWARLIVPAIKQMMN